MPSILPRFFKIPKIFNKPKNYTDFWDYNPKKQYKFWDL